MPKLEPFIANYFKYLNRLGCTANTIVGLGCCILLGVLDLVTPDEYVLSFFYLLPISFTTWFAGKRAGLLAAILCTLFLSPNYLKLNVAADAWNVLSVLGIFLIVVLMLNKIRELLELESKLSRLDPLTGAINRRAFSELVGYEMLRLQRDNKPFSLVYLDIDDFKKVNDQYGHSMGDELLKSVAGCLMENLRKTDILARMGGDEFTIFYPEANQESVKIATQRMMGYLTELSENNNWPTTISMGVVTCSTGMCTLKNIVALADNLMYKVKNAGKNSILYSEYVAGC